MISNTLSRWCVVSALAVVLAGAPTAAADVVTDWDHKACDIVGAATLGPAVENRVLAIVATAVYEATNAITAQYPASSFAPQPVPGASVPAAVAAANRATLSRLVPSQAAAIEDAYRDALAAIPEGAAKTGGIAVGEAAAATVLAARADDGSGAQEAYRPFASPGIYVPTVLPFALQWPQRRPWNLSSPAQFRPGPPPELTSATWARDYAEIEAVGARNSTSRTSEQTAIARFWTATAPQLYHGVIQSVAEMPGRDVTQNARLLAAASQAMDDALIAVFDAKYHYNFWRPITAIRNGDIDGNSATARNASWTPLIDTPMHPEYPCAHCIVSAAVGTVLQAELGDGPMPTLTTASPTAGGATRSWTRVEDFMSEVANARVWDGVHFRNSTEVGTAMGRQIGAFEARKLLVSPSAERIAAAGH